MKFKTYSFLLIAFLAITACKKSSTPTPPKNIDVYVAGNIYPVSGIYPGSIAAYWKNGLITKLTDSSSNADAEAIVVSNGDVYVAGYTTALSGNERATYWKNGKEIHLSDGTTFAVASSIA